MIGVFLEMSFTDKIKTIAGAIMALVGFYTLMLSASIWCVLAGGGPEVCGL